MDPVLLYLDNNKLFMGCTMKLMHVGGKYMHHDLPDSLDHLFQNAWLRRIVVFCVAFVATRDIKISLLVTLLYVLIFTILLNEKSSACILPKKYLDFNKDGIITKDELIKAKEILQKYHKQTQK